MRVWLTTVTLVPMSTYERLLLPDLPPESPIDAEYYGRKANKKAKTAMRNWLRGRGIAFDCTATVLTDDGWKTPKEIGARNMAEITRLVWKRRQNIKQGAA